MQNRSKGAGTAKRPSNKPTQACTNPTPFGRHRANRMPARPKPAPTSPRTGPDDPSASNVKNSRLLAGWADDQCLLEANTRINKTTPAITPNPLQQQEIDATMLRDGGLRCAFSSCIIWPSAPV